MKRIVCLLLVLCSIWLFSGLEVKGEELVVCNLDSYRVASASDIMMIDLSNETCDIVSNDIMEFSELLVLDITGKKLESQNILSAFPYLIALNAEYSNVNTLEYISNSVEDLYVAYSDITDLQLLSNFNLMNYSFDYLNLNSESREILKAYDSSSKLYPLINSLTVNKKVYTDTNINVVTTLLRNELLVDYDGNIDDELLVVNDNSNEVITSDNGVYYLDSNEVYRITYGNDEYSDIHVVTFTYVKPTIVIPNYRPVVKDEEKIEEEPVVEDIEEEIPVIEEFVEEEINEEPIIKNTAAQPLHVKVWKWIKEFISIIFS